MSTNNPDSKATPLETVRRRNRLEHLLEVRYQLAITSVEQVSHGLPEGEATHQRLLDIEDQIKAAYPDTYAESWARWVLDDAARLHGPGVLLRDCSICEQIAVNKGINLADPEAA